MKAADPEAFALVQDIDNLWTVVFEYEEDKPPYRCCAFDRKYDALVALQSIRATWRHIHMTSEGGFLVEDILLGGDFKPYTAWLVMTGWTARTQDKLYRKYVEELVYENAPSHIDIRIHWLSIAQMRSFERDFDVAMDGSALATQQLRSLLSDLDGDRDG